MPYILESMLRITSIYLNVISNIAIIFKSDIRIKLIKRQKQYLYIQHSYDAPFHSIIVQC